MGLLVEGQWKDQWYDTKSTGGAFERKESSFRNWVRADGSTDFAPEAGRYHLYVSLACPWAHRTLIMRKLKKLESAISLSVVNFLMREKGWTFSEDLPDHENGRSCLHEVYTLADPKFTGRVTVPVLWDRETRTIVNNESSEIMRMFNAEFNTIGDASLDFYPESLRSEIDQANEFIYAGIK